jgi:hypothetical protein
VIVPPFSVVTKLIANVPLPADFWMTPSLVRDGATPPLLMKLPFDCRSSVPCTTIDPLFWPRIRPVPVTCMRPPSLTTIERESRTRSAAPV